MIKIEYPKKADFLENYYREISELKLSVNSGSTEIRKKFNNKVKSILDKSDNCNKLALEKVFNLFINKKVYHFDEIFKNLDFKTLLIGDFEEIEGFKKSIGKKIASKKDGDSDKEVEAINAIKIIFNYTTYQGKVSKFFQNNNIDLDTCYYCNLDYINVIKFYSKEDFIRHISKEGIKFLTDDISIQNDISSLREDRDCDISNETELFLNEIEEFNSTNFCTLDHFFDKATYPYLALSLKNLVPSCHACNSKIKHSKSIGDLSPTSDSFDFDNKVKFKLIQGDNKDIKDILKSPQDIKVYLSDNSEYAEYSKNLRLNARYSYSNHQEKATELIAKFQNYPKEQITGLSKLLGLTEAQIREDIFGKEIDLECLSQYAYTKLKKDVYKCLDDFNQL